MADRRTSESDREAMLRRVAIVLSSLPANVAAQLLGSIDPQTKQSVRRTMTLLSDVDPLERRRALRAFKVSVEQLPSSDAARPDVAASKESIEDEVAISPSTETSHAGSRVVSSTVSVDRTIENSSPLSFLSDVQDDALVRLLALEHPQAVALVLASIAPDQAARVLPRLDPKVQTDALARIGRLGEIPEAAVAEIAQHFRTRLAPGSDGGRSANGQRALDAILAAMPAQVVAAASPHDQVATTVVQPRHVQEEALPRAAPASEFASADVPAIDLAHKIRVAERTLPESDSVSDEYADRAAQQQSTNQTEGRAQSLGDRSADNGDDDVQSSQTTSLESHRTFESTDAIHQHLLNLPPTQLCQALGKVDTRDALLALCGLPNQVAESVLAILPRAHAKQVRVQMAGLNTLHLREIDDAKEKVALASSPTCDPAVQQIPVAA